MTKLCLLLVQAYQNYISPYLGGNCRFFPSCSEYLKQSLQNKGLLGGMRRGLVRILKCHPFHPGGCDVPRP